MDNAGIIFKLAKSMLRRLLAEGEALEESEEETNNDLKKKVISFAIKSENDSRIKAMVNQIKSQPEITLTGCDTDPFLLNLSNGTLDLKTGRLREHKKSDYITRMIDIDYDKNAKCPEWMNFLHKVFLGDEQTLDFVQKSIGYSLTGSQEEQCFYMLSGTGANGKTTFLNTIKMIMGDYADVLKASSLMARQYDDGARGDIAKLKKKRFVVSSELNEGQYFDESLMKCVTGGETVPVRFINEKYITGDMYTIRVGDLYQNFSNWCLRSGYKPMSGIKFGKKLREKGFEQNKSGCCRYWKGIGVIRIRG